MRVAILIALAAVGCSDKPGLFESMDAADRRIARERAEEAKNEWEGPCRDESTLIATTAGSPNSSQCKNRLHRMRVEPVTKAGEEIGAVVFCQCERESK